MISLSTKERKALTEAVYGPYGESPRLPEDRMDAVYGAVEQILNNIADEIERELICCPDEAPCGDFCRGAIFARRLVLKEKS